MSDFKLTPVYEACIAFAGHPNVANKLYSEEILHTAINSFRDENTSTLIPLYDHRNDNNEPIGHIKILKLRLNGYGAVLLHFRAGDENTSQLLEKADGEEYITYTSQHMAIPKSQDVDVVTHLSIGSLGLSSQPEWDNILPLYTHNRLDTEYYDFETNPYRYAKYSELKIGDLVVLDNQMYTSISGPWIIVEHLSKSLVMEVAGYQNSSTEDIYAPTKASEYGICEGIWKL
jgi:hypothetical protein